MYPIPYRSLSGRNTQGSPVNLKKALLPVLLLILLLEALPAQESEDGDIRSLFERTLLADINTADYYELVSWCRDLNLSETGSAEQLRSNLIKHYNMSGAVPAAQKAAETEIVIRSARETEYFKITEVEESMVLLSGDVVLEVRETEKKRIHTIYADRIMFNQQEKTITAYGDIEYVLDDNGKKETFHGDSLTFSVDNWEGVIFEGDSSRDETIEDKKVHFFFSGKRISRTGHNVVVLEGGTITTGSLKDPDFSIRSRKIWVTGIQEWGILHGILYMGNVPIIYIPFYFKPGNDLLFNPSLGEDVRKGPFVQTTTYLLGHKKIDSSGDFFQIGLESGSIFELQRIGLYSFKVRKVDENPKENKLKLMADYYTRLGGYAAVDSQFYSLGIIESLDFQFGMGVTRSIDSSYNTFFSEGDEFVSRWNESWLFGTRLPIRFGTYVKIKAGVWSFNFEYYSDPSYYTDFADRQESFDWLNYVMSDFTSQEIEEKTYSRDISQFVWSMNGSWSLKDNPLAPWITDLSVSSIKGSVTFDKKTDAGISLEDPLSPTRFFFAPSKLTLPSLAMSLAGTLFTYPMTSEKKESPDRDGQTTGTLNPVNPWDDSVKSAQTDTTSPDSGDNTGQNDLSVPSRRGDLPVTGEDDPFKFSLTYSLSPNFNMETPTDNAGWTSPEDNDWALKQSALTLGSRGDLRMNLNFFQDFLSIKGSLGMNQNYKTHADFAGSGIELTEAEKTSDYSSTSFEWNEQFQLAMQPLREIPLVGSSSINYSFNSVLYRYKFLSYTAGSDPVYLDQWVQWNREYISQHQIGGTFVFKPPLVTVSCEMTTDLPPEPKQFYILPRLNFEWRGFSLSASDRLNYKFEEEEWLVDDFTLDAKYKAFDGKLQISQRVLYDLEESRLQESFSQLDLWFFYLKYKMNYTTTYDWDTTNFRWISGDKRFVPSELSSGIKFNYVMKPLWKNRLQMQTGVDMLWRINLVQPNDNVLSFSWNLNLNLFRFLDLKFEVVSENNSMYIYFEEWRDYFGMDDSLDYDLVTDLLKSFNFFSPGQQDRYDSFFNLKKINVTLIHHLRDWDLSLTYTGYPKREDDSYNWESAFTIAVQWNPIPSINTRIQYQDDLYYIDSGQSNAQK
jgi:hypothetical protein